MLHNLSETGSSMDPNGRLAPDLMDAVFSSDAVIALLELGTRDEGELAPMSADDVKRFELPPNTVAVAVWRLFDEIDDEEGSETIISALTADEHARVLENVMSVAINNLVRHCDEHGSRSAGHLVDKIVTLYKSESTTATQDYTP